MKLRVAGAWVVLVAAQGWMADAPAASQTRSVQFAKGSSAATIKGHVKGYDTMDHTLRAAAGQAMTVSMTATHAGAYFNVLPPGSKDVAIHIGSTSGNRYSGVLEQAGTYTIRVYLMRNEARRGTQANYTLKVGITGSAAAGDAKVAGTRFHATGQVPCTIGPEPQTMCPFGVVRGGAGQAEVYITPPGGIERRLNFAGSQVTAPGSQSVKASKQGDEWTVEVNGAERYRIPEAVVNGG